MRAFVNTGPGLAEVRDVEPPEPGPDVEFFIGGMAYLHSGEARYPIRVGHEWSGVVEQLLSPLTVSCQGRRVHRRHPLGGGVHKCGSSTARACGWVREPGTRTSRWHC